MRTVGIRALKQNASSVVAEAADGTAIVITDRGRPVAQLSPLPSTRLAALLESGHARRPLASIADLASPEPGPALTPVLEEMRDDERF